MTSLKRFWQAVESLPSLAAVETEWLAWVRGDYHVIKPFLRPCKERASSFPRPDGGLPYQVIEHGRDDLVGVCQETGETITLSRSQLVVYEVDQQRLAAQVAGALGLSAANQVVTHDGRVFSLGSFRPTGHSVAAFLILPSDVVDVSSAAASLISQRLSPFLILTPTRRFVTAELALQLRSIRSASLPLADALVVSEGGQWSIADETIRAALPDLPVRSEPLAATVVIQFIGGYRGGGLHSQVRDTREQKKITEAVKCGTFSDRFAFAPAIYSASISDVIQCHLHCPKILHFVGHGEERKLLLIRDRDVMGEMERLSPELIDTILANFMNPVQLAVFNTCFSSGLARHITESGTVQLAIGVEETISDDHAVQFAKTFYGQLAEGVSVRRAYDLANVHFGDLATANKPQLFYAPDIDPENFRFADPNSVRK